MASVIPINCLVLGSPGVGKSGLIQSIAFSGTALSIPKFHGILPVLSFPLYTNKAPIEVHCKEVNNSSPTEEKWLTKYDCAIIVLDRTKMTEETVIEQMTKWIEYVRYRCGTVPIVLCGNKVDLMDPNVNYKKLYNKISNFIHEEDSGINGVVKLKYHYFDTSAVSNYNMEKPWLEVIRKVMKDDAIVYVKTPVV